MLRMELSKKVIGILSSLLEDLKMESSDDESGAAITADDMNIEVHVSAWCRVKLLFDHLELVPLLMRIFMRSYYKVSYEMTALHCPETRQKMNYSVCLLRSAYMRSLFP